MSQKIVNRTTGLVDYKELETNILSSIREEDTVSSVNKKIIKIEP